MKQKKQEKAQKKSKAMAIASFAFGMAFWIPLLNFIFGFFAVYLGIKALLKIKNQPSSYGGKAFALIGIFLGAIVYLLFFIGFGMCLIGHGEICANIGMDFLAK